MKTIGMLGGMSWESTVSYYQQLNRGIKQRLGGLHSAKVVMLSIDFAEIEKLQHAGDWKRAGEALANAAHSIEAGGADFLLICTNTMHKVAAQVEEAISIPLLHIADATGEQLLQDGRRKVGLLGTAFTMEQEFYKGRLAEKFNLEVITPNSEDRKLIHDVIYNELCLGKVSEDSRYRYLEIIERLKAQGADSIILGCTEIALLVEQCHTDAPLYDTTTLHAQGAINFALADI
ncbi:MAG: aspartate/glutamate racemase family protein [Pseudohongiellaceae bacterium]